MRGEDSRVVSCRPRRISEEIGMYQQKEGSMKTILVKRLAIISTLLTLFSLTSLLAAQYRAGRGAVGGWQHLGNAHVDGRADHDKIEVGGGTFSALELGVTNGAIGFE